LAPLENRDAQIVRLNSLLKDPKYSGVTARADGFVVVVPEYNHSFSGSLKRMLDSESKNYIHKPVNLVGVSSGQFGGVRAIESLVPVVRELGMTVTFADVMVTNSKDAFDENNQPNDDQFEGRLYTALDELIWFARTLKYGRENFKNRYHE
jgi:NAD(P)H-dependent FMN reductase